jgi:hypothetical protein
MLYRLGDTRGMCWLASGVRLAVNKQPQNGREANKQQKVENEGKRRNRAMNPGEGS